MAEISGMRVLGGLPVLWRLNAAQAMIVTETLRSAWLALCGERYDGRQGSAVVVTSGEVGEGKTTVSAALASRIAVDGFRVLLIDADLRRPSLASHLCMANPTGKGVDAVLRGEVTLEQAVQRHPSGLDCLLADSGSGQPIKLLLSPGWPDLIDEARRRYDLVVIDTPPVLRVADAVLLAKHMDHVLFIVEAGRMEDEAVLDAVSRFSVSDRQKMRALLTKVRSSNLRHNDYYAGYETLRLS